MKLPAAPFCIQYKLDGIDHLARVGIFPVDEQEYVNPHTSNTEAVLTKPECSLSSHLMPP